MRVGIKFINGKWVESTDKSSHTYKIRRCLEEIGESSTEEIMDWLCSAYKRHPSRQQLANLLSKMQLESRWVDGDSVTSNGCKTSYKIRLWKVVK